jgi:hypothetical protein
LENFIDDILGVAQIGLMEAKVWQYVKVGYPTENSILHRYIFYYFTL